MSQNGAEDLYERWCEEMTAAWIYRAISGAEPDPGRARMFNGLAAAAERQAGIVAGAMMSPPPPFQPPLRARFVAAVAGAITPRRARPLLAAMKVRGLSVYSTAPPPESGHPMPVTASAVGERHRIAGGGTIRAAVFGINDGLVSNTSLIMGFAGATTDTHIILLSGVAGLIAGAFSMAAGEYISMRSQRELFEYQIAQEKDELALYPEEEAEELALIYSTRGVPIEEARVMTRRMLQNPERALDTLAREELGLNPDDLGSPWGAALYSFGAFAAGACLPLLPFLLGGQGRGAVVVAAALAAVALFAVGASISLFSGKGIVAGGLRMLAIGAAAGAATYGIGSLLGVQAS